METCVIYHTRFGNNTKLANKINELLTKRGDLVSIHSISESKPSEIKEAQLYIVGSPTQIGTLPLKVSRFLKRLDLPEGSRYAVFYTHVEATSGVPEKLAAIMEGNGAAVAAPPLSIGVADLKGPLAEGWESKIQEWIASM